MDYVRAIVPVSTGGSTGVLLEAEDLRSHLRLGAASTDAPGEDDLLEGKLATAISKLERELSQPLLRKQFDAVVDQFPCGTEPIRLPRWPLASVDSVTSYALDGTATVMSSSEYFVDTYSRPGRLCLKSGYTWPTATRDQVAGVIRFTAGHGTDAMGVPDPLKEAALKWATELYENREAVNIGDIVNELPFGIEELISEFRLPEIG
jgi:uncharacterized phiE125 gp8 family phage protein